MVPPCFAEFVAKIFAEILRLKLAVSGEPAPATNSILHMQRAFAKRPPKRPSPSVARDVLAAGGHPLLRGGGLLLFINGGVMWLGIVYAAKAGVSRGLIRGFIVQPPSFPVFRQLACHPARTILSLEVKRRFTGAFCSVAYAYKLGRHALLVFDG